MTEYESQGFSSVCVEEPVRSGKRKEGIEVQRLADRGGKADRFQHLANNRAGSSVLKHSPGSLEKSPSAHKDLGILLQRSIDTNSNEFNQVAEFDHVAVKNNFQLLTKSVNLQDNGQWMVASPAGIKLLSKSNQKLVSLKEMNDS